MAQVGIVHKQGAEQTRACEIGLEHAGMLSDERAEISKAKSINQGKCHPPTGKGLI